MISGNMEAKLWAGAFLGGTVFFALAAFVLLPAGLIALINRSERRATARLLRDGVPCRVFVKSYRRVSMTQHRVLFELHLPEGRVGREHLLSGLSDADLANWAALQIPLAAHADAKAIALDAAPPATGSRPFFPWLLGASLALALVSGAIGAAVHSDDEAALAPELKALCAALRRQQIDVANVQLMRRQSNDITQRALVDLDGEPHEVQRYPAGAPAEQKKDCLRNGAVELCTGSDSRNGYRRGPVSARVRAAFAAYGK
jgi:hypothetical protein